MSVIGRFAPSPSGPLHFGSLIAALGSWLSARAQGGRWLLRIEDIDPPREQRGAADVICEQLQAHGLHHDGDALFQSRRSARYDAVLAQFRDAGLLYACDCPRKRLQALGHRYDGHCRDRGLPLVDGHAWRLRMSGVDGRFQDRIWGACDFAQGKTDDPVLRRRDNLYAYQLACVVDDVDSGVSEIVRGADLLDTTPRQIALWRLLGATPPSFAHLPLVVQDDGRKLSKQNHAPALDLHTPLRNLRRALRVLGQAQPAADTVDELLRAACAHWDEGRVPSRPVAASSLAMPDAQPEA